MPTNPDDAQARAQWIAELVAEAPPLTDEQAYRLATLLPPVDPVPAAGQWQHQTT